MEMNQAKKKRYLSFLESFISENKSMLFDQILPQRSRYLTVVLEDIYQSQNASAVLRTCDCFGVQDVHIIENRNVYSVNDTVALGSSKWLNLIRYNQKKNNTLDCYAKLRSEGYKIIATTPHDDGQLLDDLNLSSKAALVFGTELEGLSSLAIDKADDYVKIPMYGFTESYNISVSVAIILHTLTEKLRKLDLPWQLSEEEMTDIRLLWAGSVIKHPAKYEKEFLKLEGLI
jgi:tRNA (guanosine-2'-O-)-methyltransferase